VFVLLQLMGSNGEKVLLRVFKQNVFENIWQMQILLAHLKV
jgi:hypothetical protein